MPPHRAGEDRGLDVATGTDELASTFAMSWTLDVVGRPVRTLVMVSKAAHCLNDLLFRQRTEGLPIDVVAVAGNHRDLEPLTQFYGKEFHHIPVTRETKAQAEELKSKGVEFIQDPEERPYGVEAVLRDNSGNWMVLVEHKEYTHADFE